MLNQPIQFCGVFGIYHYLGCFCSSLIVTNNWGWSNLTIRRCTGSDSRAFFWNCTSREKFMRSSLSSPVKSIPLSARRRWCHADTKKKHVRGKRWHCLGWFTVMQSWSFVEILRKSLDKIPRSSIVDDLKPSSGMGSIQVFSSLIVFKVWINWRVVESWEPFRNFRSRINWIIGGSECEWI